MSNYEATKYDFSGASLTGIEGIPTATIVPWTTASVPAGFLECNGAAVSRSTYSALFAVIASTYGGGDGSSTFNVPDLQNKVPLSKSNNKALASTGGADTVQATGNVSTNVTGNVGGSTANATLSSGQLASHSHPGGGTGGPYSPGSHSNNPRYYSPTSTGNTGSGSGHSHNMSANFSGSGTSTFSGGTNSVLQPYLTVMYIIKT